MKKHWDIMDDDWPFNRWEDALKEGNLFQVIVALFIHHACEQWLAGKLP